LINSNQILSWIFWASLMPVILIAQVNLIINPGFEIDDQPSIEGWEISCSYFFADDPPDNCGLWSLNLESGNTQGCFPSIAVQHLTELQPSQNRAQVLNISGWASVIHGITMNPGFGLKNYTAGEVLNFIPVSGSEWTFYEVQDTLFNLDVDTDVGIVIDAGMLSGPAADNVRFDQMTVEILAELMRGDVNADQSIDVLDVVMIVYIILDEIDDSGQFEFWAADINSDGFVNVLDIISMVHPGPFPEW